MDPLQYGTKAYLTNDEFYLEPIETKVKLYRGDNGDVLVEFPKNFVIAEGDIISFDVILDGLTLFNFEVELYKGKRTIKSFPGALLVKVTEVA